MTQPLHKLTEAEGKILAEFLKKRHIYSTNIKDEVIINKLLFSTETRKEIMDALGQKMSTFQNYLTMLRTKGVIVDNTINKKLIPNFEPGSDNFKLIYNFIVNG